MIVGKNQKRIEDGPLLRGDGRFADDISFPGQIYMRVVRSPVAYGKIENIDTKDARNVPGVLHIWTGEDVAHIDPIPFRQVNLPGMERFRQHILAQDYVRYVGDPIALVFADDPYIAEDAANLVYADIQHLDPCLEASGAVAEFKPGIPSEAGVIEKGYGDLEAAFARAHRIVSLRLKTGRHSGIPLETRGAIGHYDAARDLIELYGATKAPHRNRTTIAGLIGQPLDRLHLHEGHVGGGFGVRGELYPEDVLVCLATREFKRPVKWIEDRRENLIACNHSREQTHEIRAAVDERGFILGMDDEFWLDQGGYVRTHGGAVPDMTSGMLPGPYVVPAYRCVGHIRLTNKTPCGTYRSPGRFEGSFVRERLMDAIARELGLDPIEVRRVNLIPADALPFDRKATILESDVIYDSAKFEDLLDRLLAHVGYDALKAEIEARRAKGEYVGIGLACFVEKSGLGPFDDVEIILESEGSVEIVTGAASLGQGIETVLAQICADASGLPFDILRVTHGQTDRIERGIGTYASRGTTMTGSAVHLAAIKLNGKIRDAAAAILQADADDLSISDGRVGTAGVEGAPSLSIAELAAELAGGLHSDGGAVLSATATFESTHMGYPYGVHLVVASVDKEIASARVERFVVAYDVGKAINPMLIEGQFSGAMAQGIGGALLEEFLYDESGQPLSTNFADYIIPTVCEVPAIETIIREDAPSPLNPLGVKGAGEGGINGAGAAIAAAVDNAIGGNGAIDQIPISPTRLFSIIEKLESERAA
jgi:CO/xanthine dehydrogenase Mo-binding subunit